MLIIFNANHRFYYFGDITQIGNRTEGFRISWSNEALLSNDPTNASFSFGDISNEDIDKLTIVVMTGKRHSLHSLIIQLGTGSHGHVDALDFDMSLDTGLKVDSWGMFLFLRLSCSFVSPLQLEPPASIDFAEFV